MMSLQHKSPYGILFSSPDFIKQLWGKCLCPIHNIVLMILTLHSVWTPLFQCGFYWSKFLVVCQMWPHFLSLIHTIFLWAYIISKIIILYLDIADILRNTCLFCSHINLFITFKLHMSRYHAKFNFHFFFSYTVTLSSLAALEQSSERTQVVSKWPDHYLNL